MAMLIYSAIASLGCYIADEHGNFDSTEPTKSYNVSSTTAGLGEARPRSASRVRVTGLRSWSLSLKRWRQPIAPDARIVRPRMLIGEAFWTTNEPRRVEQSAGLPELLVNH